MRNVLLSGPAGGGKSQEARRLLSAWAGPAILADFTRAWAALAGVERGPDGRFPERDPESGILPTVESIRQAMIRIAREREVGVIATNSDGDPDRRAYLLGLLGPGAVERVIDPGRAVVEARLSDASGALSPG